MNQPNDGRKPVARRVQRNWDDVTKRRALELYQSSGVTVAAKETGIPRQTITSLAKKAGVMAGYTAGQATRVEILKVRAGERQEEAVVQWKRVRDLGTARVIEALEDGRMSPRDAAWAAAVAQDKIRLIEGDATSRVEISVHARLEASLAVLRGISRTNESQETGSTELIDATADQPRGLSPGGSVTDDPFAADALVIDAEVVEE